ncbi:Asp-tRNA(Asn)/Glu-tRNA(Gln) amidotransferase subunit GatC [Candidatus Liberibacter americanus]|uniref:Aspartyl/glutamyl-tRNA(Asn/Gln) amidotransferase subunit C n=1 Tax=Candidatus Liberibacter americanus str. Sao Paulo TaxID=1261131 RepID=U6B5H2_9HYPH|nr:Asp-tRNA(Asn)/Glu-tRNA(Gln) amidotransferase subunit GatC [Candidatus Liberibacter americanus]AHA27988.1 Asp-tRNAAsn/Glu-tRNAGln amidotransferase C subunit [Candidatus Liberibacter americanus str. Sao Paulo]EMS35887.1 glutamyl-tRNA(Gln) amidotransferase subunit C protein [Candidatus Liberibacter americanus PW_SP]
MSMDIVDVKRIARLSCIAIDEDDISCLLSRLNSTLIFLDEIAEVNVEGVEPMTSVIPIEMKQRSDIVDDGGIVDSILSNAPHADKNFFLVPKTVE